MGLNALYRCQIFALDSAVVEVQEISARTEAILLMQCTPWRNTLIKLTHHDETKKRAHDSQIVRPKKELKLSNGGSSYR